MEKRVKLALVLTFIIPFLSLISATTPLESDFVFEQKSANEITLQFETIDGQIEVPIFYGDSSSEQYQGLGEGSEDKVTTSTTSTILFQEKNNGNALDYGMFLSWSDSSSFETYFLRAQIREDQGMGENQTDIEKYTTGWGTIYLGKTQSETCSIGNLVLTIDSIEHTLGQGENATFSLNSGASANKVYDLAGNYFFIPQSNTFPKKDIIIDIYNKSGFVIEKHNISWLSNSPTVNKTSLATTTDCTPLWTAMNTSCDSSDKIIEYYIDSNDCNSTADRPSNKTIFCDYNNNGIIGNKSKASATRINLGIRIEQDPLNLTTNYTGTKKVELENGNDTIVEFDWDFTSPLNIEQITIEKQSSSDSLGYLIINGLNVEKLVEVDRILNSSQVCIKDAEVSSIDEISEDCSNFDETLVNCPGAGSGYSCSISGSNFIIQGVEHSAIIEFGSPTTCTPSWSCNIWQECKDSVQTRNCTDANKCNTTLNKPQTSRACTEICNPIFSCEDWSSCEDNEQTRTCIDTRDCEPSYTETQECGKLSKTTKTILFIAFALFVLLFALAIILAKRKQKKQKSDSDDFIVKPSNIQPKQPPTPPIITQQSMPPRPQSPIQQRPPQFPIKRTQPVPPRPPQVPMKRPQSQNTTKQEPSR